MNVETVTSTLTALTAFLGAVTALVIAFRPMLSEIIRQLHRTRNELARNTQATQDTSNALRAVGVPVPPAPTDDPGGDDEDDGSDYFRALDRHTLTSGDRKDEK